MSMSGNQGRLVGLTRDILLEWTETKNYWHDTKSEEFERRFMDELSIHVNRAVMVLEQMEELLKKVRKDCE
jgi:hypothetical protein